MNRKILMLMIVAILPHCADTSIPPPPDQAVTVYALAETDPVSSRGDAADDPAIWINREDHRASRVLGTDKNSGIEVYDLDGKRLQYLRVGRTNNVDLRYFDNSSHWSALAAATNRSTNTISLFVIDHSGELTWLVDSEIVTGLTEPYGLCMFKNSYGMQVFVNDTDGRYQQWLLDVELAENTALPTVSANLVRQFSVTSQPEGCVADDEFQRVFIGVENEGIREVSALHEQPAVLNTVAQIDGQILVADVEGMSLYNAAGQGYLVVSSQGNYSYAVYDRLPPFTYRGSFIVTGSLQNELDGTEETDGLDVSSVLLTPEFPEGLVVLQDGFNTLPPRPQNFKYVSWLEIRLALGL